MGRNHFSDKLNTKRICFLLYFTGLKNLLILMIIFVFPLQIEYKKNLFFHSILLF